MDIDLQYRIDRLEGQIATLKVKLNKLIIQLGRGHMFDKMGNNEGESK